MFKIFKYIISVILFTICLSIPVGLQYVAHFGPKWFFYTELSGTVYLSPLIILPSMALAIGCLIIGVLIHKP